MMSMYRANNYLWQKNGVEDVVMSIMMKYAIIVKSMSNRSKLQRSVRLGLHEFLCNRVEYLCREYICTYDEDVSEMTRIKHVGKTM